MKKNMMALMLGAAFAFSSVVAHADDHHKKDEKHDKDAKHDKHEEKKDDKAKK